MLVCNLFGIDLANLINKAKKSGQDSGDEDWRIHTICLDMGQLSKLQRRSIRQKHQILPLLIGLSLGDGVQNAEENQKAEED